MVGGSILWGGVDPVGEELIPWEGRGVNSLVVDCVMHKTSLPLK